MPARFATSPRRRRHARQLEHYARELERSNRDLADFAAVASHDLQAPLRRVATFCQMLARHCDGKLDERADEFLGYITEGTGQMQRLIDDLLAYSRISTRGKPFVPVDCEEVFARATNNLRPQIEESGAEVTHGRLPTVVADATQLLQLFQNLLDNAIKYQHRSQANKCRWRRSASRPAGSSASVTTAPASPRMLPRESSSSFSGCTATSGTKARVSGCRSASGS